MASCHRVKVITQVDSQEQKLKARKGKTANNWFVSTIWAPGKEKIYFDNKAIVHRLGLNFIEKLLAYVAVRFHPNAEELTMKILTTIFKRKLFPLTEGAELIHCVHGGVSYLGLTALQIAKEKGIPFVYTPVAHLFTRQNIQASKQSAKSPANSSFASLSYLSRPLVPRQWMDRFWYEICQQADALITMTHYEKAFFQKKGIKPGKIFPIGVGPILSDKGNGNDFRQKYGLGDKKIVLFLGRKHEDKGLLDTLKAARLVWRNYPDIYFVFVGPLEGKSKAIFESYRDRRILEIGAVDVKEKTNALKASDIFCVPSHEESLGGVYLEAWMYEKPIIAADIPPLQELTANGKGGFLVHPHPEAIAEKIVLLLEREDLCIRMGRWGKEKVLTYYNWDRVERQMEEIYTMLIHSKRTFMSKI
jgi:glycosyltransferase involved in cell wall biosynthesis